MMKPAIAAAIAITASSYHIPDVTLNLAPWELRNTPKRSGNSGRSRLNVNKSRKAAKSARKARRLQRSRI
jgi:hypothetical protein